MKLTTKILLPAYICLAISNTNDQTFTWGSASPSLKETDAKINNTVDAKFYQTNSIYNDKVFNRNVTANSYSLTNLNKEKTISALDKAIKLLREQSKIVLNFNPRVDDEVFERLYQVIPSGNDFEIMAKDLKNAVEDYFEGKISIIHYIAPYDLTSIFNEKFDFIFSTINILN